MSSNIEIVKTCIYCKNTFVAKTLKTKYCSHTCNSRHYKKKKRDEKLNNFNEELINKPNEQNIKVDLRHREYLSIPETALLIGISKRTVYRLIERQELKPYKLGGRTIIKRIDIDNLFDSLT